MSETFDAFCLDNGIRGRKEAFRRFLAREIVGDTSDLDYGELRAMLPLFFRYERDLAASLVAQQAGKPKEIAL